LPFDIANRRNVLIQV